jgi:hypothetical protein
VPLKQRRPLYDEEELYALKFIFAISNPKKRVSIGALASSRSDEYVDMTMTPTYVPVAVNTKGNSW